MSAVETYTISLDTPISMLTPRQLFRMLADWQNERKPKEEEKDKATERWYAHSIPELAEALHTSVSTIYRMKSAGLLDDCISQCGRWMMIDVDAVLEKFKLSNRRKKRK